MILGESLASSHVVFHFSNSKGYYGEFVGLKIKKNGLKYMKPNISDSFLLEQRGRNEARKRRAHVHARCKVVANTFGPRQKWI